MNTTRAALRSSRAATRPFTIVRHHQRIPHARRFQSTDAASAGGHTHGRTALYGGLAGGTFAFLLGYGWYRFSGVSTAVDAAHQARGYFETSKQKLKQAAPEPNQALEWLRQQTSFYAGFVPGGKQYVDAAFHDLDAVRDKHGDEVDKIVKDAYEELKGVAGKDLSVQTATEAWGILQKYMNKVAGLASDSASEIMKNHPELKDKIGGNVDQLRTLGKSFGPEAEKVVSDTWGQVKDIVVSGGIGAGSIKKLQDLIKEKTEQVKKLGNKAWDKGLEEAKPVLDKNPQLKELINSNKDALLSGNLGELWSKVKDAAQSGNMDDLEGYVKQTVDKAKQQSNKFGGDMQSAVENFLNQMLPANAGAQLVPQFQKFKELTEKVDKDKVEKLAKDTIDEIKSVLEKKLSEGKKMLDENSSGGKSGGK